jgi:ubiquinone/menaquinone biosynthesis C-methylase UbiE
MSYSLAASDDEHRRLIALAGAGSDHVIDACRRAGVAPGSTVVDLGCGPLGALSALASVVGPDGMVIGIDASAAALERARKLVPNVQLIHGDVHAIDPPVTNADLVYCRLFLLHQTDPAITLRRARAMLRPGGVLIAHEPSDLPAGAPSSEPPVRAMTRVWELVVAAARARGATTDFGRHGRTYLETAGFRVEGHRAYYVHYPPAIGYEIPRIAVHSLRSTLHSHDLATDDEIARLDEELETAKNSNAVEWVSSPLMFEWIGRLPAART